jgi:hypothetical protein
VLNRQVLDVLPAARTMQGGAALVPGVSFYSQGFVSTMSIHGSATADQHIFFDGMNIGQNLTGTGSQANGVTVNELAQTELVYDAGSQSAENALGGVRMDSIPKEGGNSLSRASGGRSGSKGSRAERQHHRRAAAVHLGQHAARLQLRHRTSCFGGRSEEQAVVPARAARVADQQPDRVPGRRAAGVSQRHARWSRAASSSRTRPVRLTWQASQRNKISWAFYKSQAGTQRFDVGCGATSGNVAACFAPEAGYALPQPAAVRQPGEVDVADLEPRAARSGAVARGADVQLQLPAGERAARHPAPQRDDRPAHGRRRTPRRTTTSARSGTRSPTSRT